MRERLEPARRWCAGCVAWLLAAPVGAGGAEVADYLMRVQSIVQTMAHGLQQAEERYQRAAAMLAESAFGDDEQRQANYRADFEHRQSHYREQAWVYEQAARSLGSTAAPAVAAALHARTMAGLERHATYYKDVAAGMDDVSFELRGYFSRETTVPDMEELTAALTTPLRALEALGAEHGIDVELLGESGRLVD